MFIEPDFGCRSYYYCSQKWRDQKKIFFCLWREENGIGGYGRGGEREIDTDIYRDSDRKIKQEGE